MNKKKQRGQRRRLDALIADIEGIVPFQRRQDKYEHFHVPCGMFIDSPKTRGRIKTAFCRKWLETTARFISAKPRDLPFCRVVCVIDVPYMWLSQIIIFYDEQYYNTFWDRHDKFQSWEPIADGVAFAAKRNISTTMMEKGYHEKSEDDGGCHECNLWFYGELPEI